MRPVLVPCTACHRHAFAAEPACPFCGGTLSAPRPVLSTTARVTRAAIMAGTMAVAACGPSKGAGPNPAPTSTVDPDPSGPVALYGAPAPDPSTTADPEPEPEPHPDPGGPVAEYGAPAPPPPEED
jgi:hypothetical protein